jgi:hypothetical protein
MDNTDTGHKRLDPGFFEADDEGYIQTPEEAGPDGKATGIEAVLYVDPPHQQLSTLHEAHTDAKFEFTEEELDAWPEWVQKAYPADDWYFDAMPDQASASFFLEYADEEDTDGLILRLCVDNSRYNNIRTHCGIYYSMLQEFIDHCRQQRERDERES